MPNGNYDEEAGVCWPDEFGEAGEESSEFESQLPDYCRNPWGGYNDQCLDTWMLGNALKALWDWLFGGSD